MKVLTDILPMKEESGALREAGKRIALVPTMGYLHRGHLSLIETARQQADAVVVSVFVNPTQFAPNEDFARYPRDFDRDRRACEDAGVDVVFHPSAEEMYPAGHSTTVDVSGVSSILEGAIRPTHFKGVTTVVNKLFNIVAPHSAVFGRKDVQQAFIIRKMVRDLDIPVRVVVAPTVREEDGLALSSRNVYLSADERKRATVLIRSLRDAEAGIAAGERSVAQLRRGMDAVLRSGSPTSVDYVTFVDPETFREVDELRPPSVIVALAVRFGTTRLIDNLLIEF